MKPPRIIVHDWETTGLTKHPDAPIWMQPKAIEFGAVLLDEDGEIVSEHSLLIDPREPLEPVITKITGLTDADLRGKPTFAQAAREVRALFRSCRAVVAHNLPFDEDILRYEVERFGMTLSEFGFPEIKMCTVQEYMPTFGRRPKLQDLYERFMGVPLAQTHRALDDVKALVEIIQKENLWRYLS